MTISTRQMTFYVLRRMHTGQQFTGAELAYSVRWLTKKQAYVSSVLRHMREYRELYGVDIECIDNDKSLYEIIG